MSNKPSSPAMDRLQELARIRRDTMTPAEEKAYLLGCQDALDAAKELIDE